MNAAASTDIDIDFFDRDIALVKLPHIKASILREDELTPHASAVYFQHVPIDPKTGLASINYKETDMLGFFKIDFLNASMYEGIKNEEHLNMLLSVEPNWSLLGDRSVVEQLPHIGNYYDSINKYPINSIEDLAVFLALIRRKPTWYESRSWDEIKSDIWDPINDDEGYYFKKAHSISYAVAIGCLMVKIETDRMANV